MKLHCLLLATFFLTNSVTPNSGAPAEDPETELDVDEFDADTDADADADTDADANTDADADTDANTNADADAQQEQGSIGSVVSNGGSWDNANKQSYSTWASTTTKEGQCVTEISITGHGIKDTIDYPCSVGLSTHISAEDILIANNSTVETNSVYGKKKIAGQLQMIKEGECSLRTSTTTDGGTTVSSSPVTGAECDAMKKEHRDRMKKWQQWEVETFPPCFPFCDTARPGSDKPQPPGSATGASNPWSWNAKPFAAPSSGSASPSVPPAGNNFIGGPFTPYPSLNQYLSNLFQMLSKMRSVPTSVEA